MDVFPLREEVPATRMMTSALWLKGRLVVPRFAPGDQLAGLFEEHAQVRHAWTLSLMQVIQVVPAPLDLVLSIAINCAPLDTCAALLIGLDRLW